jgi:RNA polymerase sigma-70 factor (ECF subfamily)
MGKDGEPDDITGLLRRVAEGDAAAADALYSAVLSQLKITARALMRGQPAGHSLQASALVNEAYLRLAGGAGFTWKDRQHFFCAAARAMKCILIDHARAKKRLKRQAPAPPSELDALVADYERRAIDLLALDEALQRLTEED